MGAAAGGAAGPHRLDWFRPGRTITVTDRYSRTPYTYRLTAEPGKDFDPMFRPELTPGEMLAAGVFEGKYLNDCQDEYPYEWFEDSTLRRVTDGGPPDTSLNEFGVGSRLPLHEWRVRGWIVPPDPRGWFQWYCRYWIGRRIGDVDAKQIARWRSFARHRGQIIASYDRGDIARGASRSQKRNHRARQRQALLQWAYNPWV